MHRRVIAAVAAATLSSSALASLSGPVPGSAAVKAGSRGRSPVVYVASYKDNLVTPVNTGTRRAGLAIRAGLRPDAVAVAPNGKTAYAVFAGSDTVVPIDTASGQAGRPITVGKRPSAIAITPDGRTAYVADNGSAHVTPIDLADNRAGPAIRVGSFPRAIAITPDGRTAYVVSSDVVTPIQLSTDRPLRAIKIGRNSRAIAITPNGRTAYVVSTNSATVTPIRTSGNAALPAIHLGGLPHSIVMSPDGLSAYVIVSRAGGAGFVVPIRTSANKALKAIRAGRRPAAIAIAPDGKTIYVAGGSSVTAIRDGKAQPAIGVGIRAIAVAANARFAYVTSNVIGRGHVVRGRLTIIKTATGTVSKTIGLAPDPVALAVAAPAASVTLGTARPAPLCNNVVASAPTLGRIATKMLKVPGAPFGVAVTPDGKWDLAAGGNLVIVVRNTTAGAHVVHVIKLPQGHAARGDALTPDGKYLLVADLRAGADVIDVAKAIAGKPGAVLGTLDAPQPAKGAFEIAFSADGRFAFVTIAGDQEIAVFNLGLALTSGFGAADYVGAIPAGKSNVGITTSPDHRLLYVTSEASSLLSKHGLLSVISVSKAETDPAHSVLSTVDAGCRPVRVIVSADGKTVWVTARQSNAVLAFSARKLLADPRHALITWVRVGVQPIGMALVNCGSQVVVADSHRFKAKHGVPNLAVIDVRPALTGHPALAGYLISGLDPRQLAVAPDGRVLLVGNFGSGQLETVSLSKLPGASRKCQGRGAS